MAKNWPKPIIALAGYSGSGKTTLLSQLIPLLKEQGLRVVVVKHSHHKLELDKHGKDSHQFVEAGADQVILACPNKRYHFSVQQQHDELDEQLNWVNWSHCDLVIVEGYRHNNVTKIEIYRKLNAKPVLHPTDQQIIAIATPDKLETDLPLLDLNKPKQIRDFILAYTNKVKFVK
ncbi:molybdopterin-guanine dinucleotide biosynthesis protein B [Agarivorans sp. Alg241-V36]|uniref:molybdopterin-guanine dinucleotide biosynthesis protein B n=1 Tax=Agarivorans sp. Alg241-V36 TaxID=2305992 RepID=UPI0013D481EE|nr:molybdopterin-guanine dinucleotide biosynthesis protein B [Agarivorans sp. Alg241-V36]